MAVERKVFDQTVLEPVLERYAGQGRSALLPLLFEVQAQLGYLPEEAVTTIGKTLRVPLADIFGVIEFYTLFYTQPVGKRVVRVCTSPMCAMKGSRDMLTAAATNLGVEVGQTRGDGEVLLESAPCLGLCDHAPAVLVNETPAGPVTATDVSQWTTKPAEAGLGVVVGEPRWLTARCGEIAPTDIEAYRSMDGFAALRKALNELEPGDVIDLIKASGLVGRGGAAFPTGVKWEYTAAAPGDEKFIVCNADESEPGTFKDRVLMEGDPYSILEGMAIAGYAIGAKTGYLYVRGEYPRAQRILQEAIDRARLAGCLGEGILGTDFSFEVILRSGAGAYICGEETALFESIEGKRGFPRLKPPFPTTHGLFGKPTAINNVETLCAAAWIVQHGFEAYRSVGTEGSPGSKLFCLSGDVQNPGVYEVPFGTRLADLIAMAGGSSGELQAILLGGAAGAFAGPGDLDLRLSFEDMRAANLPLGSGVVTLINKERDLKQFLQSLAHFFSHESCGKCFPCQLGTQRQVEIIDRMADGGLQKGDLAALQDIGFAMTNASLCGLGMTAATAILSALERWPELGD